MIFPDEQMGDVLRLPGASPAARAANSIVLPEDGTVMAGVLSLDQDAVESLSRFSQWVPDSQGICDPESCSPGYMVSLGGYAQDTELIHPTHPEALPGVFW